MRFRHPNLYMSFHNLRLNTRSCAGDMLPKRMKSICELITAYPNHVCVSHPDPNIDDQRTYYINIHKRCRWMMEYPCEVPTPGSPAVIIHPEDTASLLVIRNISGGLEIVTYGKWEDKNAEFAKYMTQVSETAP